VQVTFGLVTEFQEMQKWDTMLISLDVLDEQIKAYPVTHVGTFISTYGVPGEGFMYRRTLVGVIEGHLTVTVTLAVRAWLGRVWVGAAAL
jgi:hypothetical protein